MQRDFFKISPRVQAKADEAMALCQAQFQAIDAVTEYNQQKMLAAFIQNGVSESHFTASTGYGYGDRGREALDRVAADVFGAQDALVRHTFTCGTHTLAVALFGVLRPGDTMLCVMGTPYDTIHSVIGLSGEAGQGSLKDFGVAYRQTELDAQGRIDFDAVRASLSQETVKLVYVQRSRGYSLRPSLSPEEIGELCELVHRYSNAIVFVDNCYGEFVCKTEPTQCGADLMAGSLIKNPGGGIAPTGGYIAGRKDLIALCANRMTTPGLGREVGCTLNQNRALFMGFFNAPHVTGEAVKTAVFTAALFERLGYGVTPCYHEKRCDIIQSVMLEHEQALVAFCQGMQRGAPVDAFVSPEPWDMPGYDSKVIMAAGAFTLGASIELSADAPLREPYAAWMQGGLNFHSAKMGVLLAAQEMEERGLLK